MLHQPNNHDARTRHFQGIMIGGMDLLLTVVYLIAQIVVKSYARQTGDESEYDFALFRLEKEFKGWDETLNVWYDRYK